MGTRRIYTVPDGQPFEVVYDDQPSCQMHESDYNYLINLQLRSIKNRTAKQTEKEVNENNE